MNRIKYFLFYSTFFLRMVPFFLDFIFAPAHASHHLLPANHAPRIQFAPTGNGVAQCYLPEVGGQDKAVLQERIQSGAASL